MKFAAQGGQETGMERSHSKPVWLGKRTRISNFKMGPEVLWESLLISRVPGSGLLKEKAALENGL